MGYRYEHKNHGMDVVLPIDNGTISHISIPCFRRPHYGHDCHHRNEHDHRGWPAPDSSDDSCQEPWEEQEPDIDLLEEGYDSVEVSLLDQPEGFSISGQIDGNKVKLVITAVCESAETECVDVPFAVYLIGSEEVEGEDEPVITMRDLAAKGIIHIIEGPVSDIVPWVAPTTEERIEENVTESVTEHVDELIDQRIDDATGNGSITVNDDGTVDSHADAWVRIPSGNIIDEYLTLYTPVTGQSGQYNEYHMSDYFSHSSNLFINRFKNRIYGWIYFNQEADIPADLHPDQMKQFNIAAIKSEYIPSCMTISDTADWGWRGYLEDGPTFVGKSGTDRDIKLEVHMLPVDLHAEHVEYRPCFTIVVSDVTEWARTNDFLFYVDYPVGGRLELNGG